MTCRYGCKKKKEWKSEDLLSTGRIGGRQSAFFFDRWLLTGRRGILSLRGLFLVLTGRRRLDLWESQLRVLHWRLAFNLCGVALGGVGRYRDAQLLHQFLHHVVHVGAKDQVGRLVDLGGLQVADDDLASGLLGQQRQRAARHDLEGGTEAQDEVRGPAVQVGRVDGVLRKLVLPVQYGVVQVTATEPAVLLGYGAGLPRGLLADRLGRRGPDELATALVAAVEKHVSVQVGEDLRREARLEVQAVHVLADQKLQLRAPRECHECHVCGGRYGVVERNVDLGLLSLLLEGPDASWTSEVRDAGRSADAGTGDDDDVLGGAHPVGETRYLVFEQRLLVEVFGLAADAFVGVLGEPARVVARHDELGEFGGSSLTLSPPSLLFATGYDEAACTNGPIYFDKFVKKINECAAGASLTSCNSKFMLKNWPEHQSCRK